MTSPTTSSSTSTVGQSTSLNINALLGGIKWGGVVGTGTSLGYSFPWTTSASATFSGHNGIGEYSTLYEQTATEHYGLSATQQAAARNALQAWANVANITFSEVAESTTNVGDIRLAWTSATQTTSTGNLAWGWSEFPSSYWPSAGDIWISTKSSGATNTDWSVGSYNYEALIHELGHALGLKHPFDDTPVLSISLDNRLYTVMSYTDPPHSIYASAGYVNGSYGWIDYDIDPETPMVLDIAAIQYLYGANTSYRTGNDTYTFDITKPFFKTIWDAGGSDAISASNFTLGCVIDLTPGNYSSLRYPPPTNTGGVATTYDGTNNLGIAYGCIIENAIGGSGNDTLIGNSANNSLDGGAGNDTLYGGAGNDFFDWDAANRGGNDVFYGGTGNDIYVLNSSLDSVIEYSSEGTDTVWVSFSYSLANLPNIENLYAFGLTGVTLTGNAANNTLDGTSINDTIDGGAGNDTVSYSGASVYYTITTTAGGFTIVSATDGTDTLRNVEFAEFSDRTITLANSDTTVPTISTFSPIDEATGIAIGSNITLTFSESIQRGTGSILLKTAAGTTVATYDAVTSVNLSIFGSTLTINPTADLAYSTGYKVEFAAGTIKDLAGNSYAGTTSYNFTTANNGIPVATSTALIAVEDTAKTGTLAGTDPDGSTLTFAKVTNPSHGTVTINASTGAYVYTPTSNYNGGDSFTFKVNDGTADSATSTVSITVSGVNDPAAGTVAISGIATQGQILTATNTLADVDGLGTISYQWKATGVNIAGATSSTLVLAEAQVGKAISVTASYTDGQGAPEAITSMASAAVANTNDAPTGSVTITGTPAQGQSLTATNTLADLDGLGVFSYLWKSDGVAITGGTLNSLTLLQAQVGKPITVAISYTDGHGTAESVASTATGLVANVNDAPTGTVTISGIATQGQTLAGANSLADADGLGTISYQWKAAGVNIAGANANMFTLTQAEVGKVITVSASYTDVMGTAESKTSGPTALVLDTTAPTVTTFSPIDKATGIGVDSNIVVTFNEAIQRGGGTIILKTAADTTVATYDAATNAELSIVGNTLTINPTSDLAYGINYKVEFAGGTVKDLAGNSYAGTVSYNFTTVSMLISGGAGNDILTGTTGADLIYGNGGDDRITGMGGGDSIYGGSGIDTVVFAYDSGDYLVSKNPTTGSYEVISKTGAIDYVDADLEKMAFRDITVDSASYKYYGTTDPVLAGSVSSVYRFFNTNDNAFFYTNSVTERDTVLANSDVSHNNVGEWPYVYQGSSFEAAHSYAGAVPLERFYNTVTHHHFFTSSATEAATVKANSASGAWPFVYEGVSLYVYASDPTPNGVGQEIAVERFYSASLNRHWFTADQTEIAQIRLTGLWVDEGIGFWGEKPGA
ncbi:MAG: Ig-like domain-containing protein [Burkholderiales bacterium]|nr:Ig-like domain-containing protein [Burkholderiales bacterium]